LGQGSDAHGKFALEGSVNLTAKTAKLRKWYMKGGGFNKITWRIRGVVDDYGIVGVWGDSALGGPFRLWPALSREVDDEERIKERERVIGYYMANKVSDGGASDTELESRSSSSKKPDLVEDKGKTATKTKVRQFFSLRKKRGDLGYGGEY